MTINKAKLIEIGLALALGVLWLAIIRALFFYPEPVHYHANFGVFINGQRQTFDSPTYYEEALACTQNEAGNPRGRAHLHQPSHEVVHVHDEAVTWGNFFANIGWTMGNNLISDGITTYPASDRDKLVYELNGERTRSIANRVIGNEDKLIIFVGPTGDLSGQADQVASNAAEFNETYDPGSCSGDTQPTFFDRLRFGLLG